MRARLMPLLTTLSLAACATGGQPPSTPTTSAMPASDTLYIGPRFVTPKGHATAVLVGRDGLIRATFTSRDAWPDVPTIELPGALALPGLVDAHLHLAWLGRTREQVDLTGSTSTAEVRRRVEAFAAAHPELTVIQGTGWDQTLFTEPLTGGMPHARDLGELGVPVVLSRVDGHAVWMNRAAIERAGAFLGTTSPGMRVLTDEAGPTGVVIDPIPAFWDLVLPPPRPADLERWLRAGLAACEAAGLVEVHDMATSPAELAALERLAAAGLPLRVVVYLDDSEASFAWLAAHPGGPRALTPDLHVAGVKLFADGALGSRGAALKADYSDEPGHRGLLADPAAWTAKAVAAARLGYPVAIHAIGDEANRAALEAISLAREAARAAGHPELVYRIEHAQVIDLADLPRFLEDRVIASMQPTHATSDMRWAEARLGPDRIRGAYAWATLRARGVPLAFGSDAPVEPVSPLFGLFAAVTRQTPAGEPVGGWRREEVLPFHEALSAFTEAALAAAPLPTDAATGRRGRLEPGARFELTLLDREVRSQPLALIDAAVLGTVRGHRLPAPTSR